MFAKIFGWCWIIAGIIFVIKPQLLKNRFQKKSLKKLKRFIFALAVILGFFLIATAYKYHGLLPKIIMVIGIISIIKGVFFLKAKAADALLEKYSKFPLSLYRFGACFYIVIGILILNIGK